MQPYQPQDMFHPEQFRKEGHALIDLLADYLTDVGQQREVVLSCTAPDEEVEFWKTACFGDNLAYWKTVVARSIHLHHPRYMGHQTAVVANEAALSALVGAVLNNGMAVYEMGAVSTAQEQILVEVLAQALGFGFQAGGFLTSGGTLANLTALLTARAVKTNRDVWEEGMQEPLALLVSEEAHYCVDRAVRIMGWGSAGIIRIPTNSRMQMDTTSLPSAYEEACASGKKVVALVGSAGSTSTGSFDPLNELADFAGKHQLWFHVDGAHGAAVTFSDKYKLLLRGIERADSVVMDFHKLLGTPGLTTALVYRNGADSFRTF
ncbi:MAG TPA: pyridoxal-dependent decarboxylase, partial [Rhodothermales bacterium]|nr:pyridoxal-dependent decarboxylase [Rhodothermales bacterium]